MTVSGIGAGAELTSRASLVQALVDQTENARAKAALGVEDQIYGLVPGSHAELAESRRQVTLDGALGEVQTLGDLAVHVAHHEQSENLLLARGERRRRDLARMLSWHARLTGLHSRDARANGLLARVEHDARRARREHRANVPALDACAGDHDRNVAEHARDGSDEARRRGSSTRRREYDERQPG